jgi:hypothetical protein
MTQPITLQVVRAALRADDTVTSEQKRAVDRILNNTGFLVSTKAICTHFGFSRSSFFRLRQQHNITPIYSTATSARYDFAEIQRRIGRHKGANHGTQRD